MAFPKINTEQMSKSLACLLHESLSLSSLPEVRVKTSIGIVTVDSDNLATHQHFSMFRDLHIVGKGYLTNPDTNLKGSVASLEILLTGTLHDGQETARTFASLDLMPNGEIAFIRFGNEASDLRQVA